MSEHARQAAQTLRDALQTPFGSLEELCQVLAQPLYAFDLISQPTYAAHKAARDDDTWLQLDSADKAYIIKVYWSQFQEILATKVVVDWLHELRKAHLDNALWIPFFCPPKASDYALQIARISLTTLLSILGNKPSKEKLSSVVQKKTVLPEFVRDTCMFLLQQQIKQFTLFDYFRGLYVASAGSRKGLPEWQAFVDVYFSLPAKVSNTTLDGRGVPTMLEWRAFCVSLSRQLEQVMCATSLEAKANLCLPGLSYAIAKIARSGFMGFDKGHTSFWSAILPKLKHRLLSSSYKQQIGQLWQAVTADLSTADFRTFFLSLISALDDGNGHEAIPREIKQASVLLTRLIGGAQVDDGRAFPIAIRGVLLARAWKSSMARILVLWIKGSENSGNPSSARLLQDCLELWADKDVIERAPVAYHTYLTSVLLLMLRSMPALDKAVIEMSRSSSFLTAITTHLSTIREIVRLQGMLVAEEVSKKSLDPSSPIKPLDFGDIWQEAGPNYTDIRNMKEWLDASKDDSKVADWELPEEEEGVVEEPQDYQQHQHFATPGQDAQSVGNGRKERTSNQSKEPGLIQVLDTSSDFDDYDEIDEPDLEPYALPPKPAAQDLKDIEDLSAYTPEKRKAKPPVYIPDLCAYLKSDDANKLDVGLKEAADLIRRKAQWGTELVDSAVELAYILSGLQDNFSLEHFEERRRQALAALVASAPERAAPAVIEQFFSNQYSLHQKTTMLASLAFGARELAGMPIILPSESPSTVVTQSFPSQRLPGKLHDRFLPNDKTADVAGKELALLTEDITNMALSRTRESTEDQMPQANKEKLLTVHQTRRKVAPVSKSNSQSDAGAFPIYNELAVNTFIMPLFNRFWLYLRDVATSPQDFRSGVFQGGSAGSVTLLEPLLLSKFISTVTVLVESARHSPHYLAILAPEAIELVLAIRGMNADDETVQTSMLQLALIVLDGSISVDGGRLMSREHSKPLWQLKDWAESVWVKSEGREIGPEGRAAAGVLLRVDTVLQKTIGYV